ncbi:hypothetical protein JCM3775_000852 [Rhodotorula graminis]
MQCVACSSNALTCTSATVALSCQRGSFLTSDGKCVTSSNCPSSTFADLATRKCVACASTAAQTYSDASPTGATACKSKFCLLNGKCYAQVRPPAGYYCPAGVATPCTGAGVAKCNAKGEALACKSGYLFDSIAKTCNVPCTGPGVATCDSDGVPTGCNRPFHFASKSNSCILCNDYQFWNAQTQECVCSDGFFSVPTFSGGANGTPSSGCHLCSGLSPSEPCNAATAETCFRYYDETTGGCPRECRENSDGTLPATYYYSTPADGPRCKSCGGVEIDSCTGLDAALACRSPYVLDAGKCVLPQ